MEEVLPDIEYVKKAGVIVTGPSSYVEVFEEVAFKKKSASEAWDYLRAVEDCIKKAGGVPKGLLGSASDAVICICEACDISFDEVEKQLRQRGFNFIWLFADPRPDIYLSVDVREIFAAKRRKDESFVPLSDLPFAFSMSLGSKQWFVENDLKRTGMSFEQNIKALSLSGVLVPKSEELLDKIASVRGESSDQREQRDQVEKEEDEASFADMLANILKESRKSGIVIKEYEMDVVGIKLPITERQAQIAFDIAKGHVQLKVGKINTNKSYNFDWLSSLVVKDVKSALMENKSVVLFQNRCCSFLDCPELQFVNHFIHNLKKTDEPLKDPRVKTLVAEKAMEKDKMEEESLEDYCCTICSSVFHRPVSLNPCNHIFCLGCFMMWSERKKKDGEKANCPHCRRITIEAVLSPMKALEVEGFLKKNPDQARPESEKIELDKHSENFLSK